MHVVIFWEEGFPFVDCTPLEREALVAALAGHTVEFAGVAALPAALRQQPAVLITPYGSAFPTACWEAFTDYLRAAGSWVNLGGAPLTRPVHRDGDAWHVGDAQTAYGRQLRINHAFPVALPVETCLQSKQPHVDLSPHLAGFHPTRGWELQVRFTDDRVFDECGSSGRRDAVMTPLLHAVHDGRVLAAPVVAIDRLAGEFAGSRWVLATCDAALPGALLAHLCAYAAQLRVQMEVNPSFACYYPGEQAVLRLRVTTSAPTDVTVAVRVYAAESGETCFTQEFALHTGIGPAMAETPAIAIEAPGLYLVQASATLHGQPVAVAENGFWRYDAAFMSSATPLSLNKDYFLRDDQPYPITGATYMSTAKHREFLFEPNAAAWNSDFAALKAAGANMVRTGLWMGWKRAMVHPGAVDEGVLRAFTAFLLTARRYDIPVIFTLFAFLPEAWSGGNYYLDPDAVRAQAEFVGAFAQRFRAVNHLLWDFINEPSFCAPDHLWETRPQYDRHEHAAWTRWQRAQGVSDDEWRRRWRLTSGAPLDLPTLQDFDDVHNFEQAHPLRVLDYRRFAQEMFTHWAATMAAVVRENSNPHQLLVVGQDEGGTKDSPNPWFHGPAVDFTSNHSWWQNDDLLWDSVMTKTPERPNLMEETGIMFLEHPDGGSWRTPEVSRNLLEKKAALSFACGCAGFIEWLWNTCVYNNSDNEAGIGMLRASGSEKPELAAFRAVARFMADNAPRMVGRRAENVCMVIPHSNMFSVRNLADAATRRAVRTCEYRLGVPMRAVSEHRADEIGDARLIVLPSARVLTESCWQALLRQMQRGATVLVTGFIEADDYWQQVSRLHPFHLDSAPCPVMRHERIPVEGHDIELTATFPGEKVQKLEKAITAAGQPLPIQVLPYGDGKLIYCPLPMELAEEAETEALYRLAVDIAGLACGKPEMQPGLLIRPVEFAECTLYLLISESGATECAVLHGPGHAWQRTITVPAGRTVMAFLDRDSGEVLSMYHPDAERDVNRV